MEKVEILWTGGFDSTFRILQLSKLDVVVQPYYLLANRNSQVNELEAIADITQMINNLADTKFVLLPLVKLNISDIDISLEVKRAYDKMRECAPIGIQYSWLAAFSHSHPGIELCIEFSSSCKILKCIKNYGSVLKDSNKVIEFYRIDLENSHPDLNLLLGSYRFPSPLYEMTKLGCKDQYIKQGNEEIMAKTWFCHSPINNMPCGLCNPCKALVSEHMQDRLGDRGYFRYKYRNIVDPYIRFKKRFLKSNGKPMHR